MAPIKRGFPILSDVTGVARDAVSLACARVGPTLSPTQWASYLAGVPYEPICR